MSLDSALSGVSQLRNKVIGRAFRELKLTEHWGSGLKRMLDACRHQDIPAPKFEELDLFFRVTLYPKSTKIEELSYEVRNELKYIFEETLNKFFVFYRVEDAIPDWHKIFKDFHIRFLELPVEVFYPDNTRSQLFGLISVDSIFEEHKIDVVTRSTAKPVTPFHQLAKDRGLNLLDNPLQCTSKSLR